MRMYTYTFIWGFDYKLTNYNFYSAMRGKIRAACRKILFWFSRHARTPLFRVPPKLCRNSKRAHYTPSVIFTRCMLSVIKEHTRIVSNSAPTWSSRCCFTACQF